MFSSSPIPPFVALTGFVAAISIPVGLSKPAFGHESPSGWQYPYACCSGYDCREVPARAISERPEGYVINTTGEVVAYTDKRVRNSPDGVYHWCSVAGKNDGRTICLFVPPKAF